MKKFYSLIISVLIMLSCVMFSACRDKYENLEMSFYSTEGEKLTEIETLYEGTGTSLKIGIKFDNVKEITYADTVANDCGVYYTINPAANEWKVFDSAPVDARYVVMMANADTTINIEKFEVGFTAYGDYAIDTDLENGSKIILI